MTEKMVPVMTDLPQTPSHLLEMVWCKGKSGCITLSEMQLKEKWLRMHPCMCWLSWLMSKCDHI